MSIHWTSLAPAAWAQFWQVTAVVLVAAIVTRCLLRSRPHLAYMVWLLVLIKCLTPPVVSSRAGVFCWIGGGWDESSEVVAPSFDRATPTILISEAAATLAQQSATESPLAAAPRINAKALDQGDAAGQSPVARVKEVKNDLPDKAIVAAGGPNLETNTSAAPSIIDWKWWVFGIWIGGAAVTASTIVVRRLICGVVLARRIIPTHPAIERRFDHLRRQLGVRRKVRLLTTDKPIGPAAFGIFRPTVVIPQAISDPSSGDENREQIDAILAHELIHVRRGDPVAGMLQLVANSLWWFHPMIWWASRETIRVRERCCDDEAVAGLGCSSSDYAQSLLDMITSTRSLRGVAGVPGIRAVDITKQRLEHVMDNRPKYSRTPRSFWALLVLCLAIVLPGAGLQLTGADRESGGSSPSLKLQMTERGNVTVFGQPVPVDKLEPILERVIELRGDKKDKPFIEISVAPKANAGKVQALIQLCQDLGLVKFSIRSVPIDSESIKPPQQAKGDDPAAADERLKWLRQLEANRRTSDAELEKRIAEYENAFKMQMQAHSAEERAKRASERESRILVHKGGKALRGHDKPVNAVLVTPDGKHVVSASSDDTIRLWSEDGNQAAVFHTRGEGIWTLAVSPDGQVVAAGCNNGTVVLWNIAQAKPLRDWKVSESAVWCVKFSPDGHHLAVGTQDGKVQLWDVGTGEQKFTSKHRSQISGVAFTPDGDKIVTSSTSWTAQIWSAKTGEKLLETEKGPSFLQWVDVSDDGRFFVTACWDGTAQVWNLADGKFLRMVDHSHGNPKAQARYRSAHMGFHPALCVSFMPGTSIFAVSGQSGTVSLWNAETGQRIHTLNAFTGSIGGHSFSPDGRRLLAGGENNNITIWTLPELTVKPEE